MFPEPAVLGAGHAQWVTNPLGGQFHSSWGLGDLTWYSRSPGASNPRARNRGQSYGQNHTPEERALLGQNRHWRRASRGGDTPEVQTTELASPLG
jgi:hypothetical protein